MPWVVALHSSISRCAVVDLGNDVAARANWHKLFFPGFKTCFGPSTQGVGTQGAATKTHLESTLCAMWKKREQPCTIVEIDLGNDVGARACGPLFRILSSI